ncbi:MAG: hypothetical protein ACK559_32820, partial [bacterium]
MGRCGLHQIRRGCRRGRPQLRRGVVHGRGQREGEGRGEQRHRGTRRGGGRRRGGLLADVDVVVAVGLDARAAGAAEARLRGGRGEALIRGGLDDLVREGRALDLPDPLARHGLRALLHHDDGVRGGADVH